MLLLLVVTLSLLIAILLRVEVTSIKEGDPQDKAEKKVVIDKEEYERNIASALDEYEQVVKDAGVDGATIVTSVSSNDPIFQRIEALKNKIVNIKAPSAEYKDLHMNLLMSLLSIKDYLETPESAKSIACVDYVKKVQKSHELLLD